MDQVKEKLSWYKLLFTMLITIFIGNISWFMSSYRSFSKTILLIDMFIELLMVFAIGIVVYKVRFYLNKLGDK